MRKVSVRCAAANEDEDEDFESFVAERAPKRARSSSQLADTGAAAEQVPPMKTKKEKEFAWMESDDEDDAEPSGEQIRQDADDEEATLDNLDAVQSVGRMMLLSDSLKEKLITDALGAGEVAAACRALARSKFFDAELLEDLCATLQAMLRGDKLMTEHVTDAITCLKELNYYKKDVFSAVALAFKPKVSVLSTLPRSTWLKAMRGLGHASDLDFMQMLEVPPLLPGSPNFRVVKCNFFAKGNCALGASCTYAHNNNAPLSLDVGGKEDAWRKRSVMMTHEQKYVFKEVDKRGQTAQLLAPTQQNASSVQNQPSPAAQLASLAQEWLAWHSGSE
eukprot:gnl/TRDRNA2_/TRDRNA2_203609_c0_seq1.p1 gnl/TRDRNA2_/TRDRNA2_203609_c0~~gnl/TRDRNA2_/TRDRNA2_203609_c0_seq1.p1  ORF type:complete len:334 (-),score=82.35 gnl/TRDRNA2_/TRDRNA2_203609_c0_seq1:22-1023(-)